jgi:hypothetical protein
MKSKNLISSIVTSLVAVAGMSGTAVAGTIRDDRSDLQYRNLANLYPSVGRLDLRGPSTSWGCSGTLISSNWLLTAAHCLEDQAAGSQNLRSGGFTLGGISYSINLGVKYGGWVSSNRDVTAGVDLALFRLNSPVQNVAPAALNNATNEDLQVGTYVGFGTTGNGLTGYQSGTFGTKRAGQNIMGLGSRLGYSNQLLVSDFDDPRSANWWDPLSQPLNLEYQVAPGDSGGGMFINGLLAGVNSFIDSRDGRTDSSYRDYSATTRVSSYSNWIRNVMWGLSSTGVLSSLPRTTSSAPSSLVSSYVQLSESELIGDLSEPLTVHDDIWDNSETVPEPTTIVGSLLSLSGLIAARRRRRQQASN